MGTVSLAVIYVKTTFLYNNLITNEIHTLCMYRGAYHVASPSIALYFTACMYCIILCETNSVELQINCFIIIIIIIIIIILLSLIQGTMTYSISYHIRRRPMIVQSNVMLTMMCGWHNDYYGRMIQLLVIKQYNIQSVIIRQRAVVL